MPSSRNGIVASISADHARRMLQEAKSRIHDAEILSSSVSKQSDSDALLEILGFEILLKCALALCGRKTKHIHNYRKLWSYLPDDSKHEIIELAQHRMTTNADYSDIERILLGLQHVFIQGRYYYELYENFSLAEQTELGQLWEDLGAPIEEAELLYYPMELGGLNYALEKYICQRLDGEGHIS